MEMSIRELILVKRDIGNSLSALKKYITQHELNTLSNEVEIIESDFRLMCGYMQRGYKDPQLETVYDGLLRRVFRLYGNVRMESLIKKRPSFMAAKRFSFDVEMCHVEIRKTLETFVQDVALNSLLDSSQPDSLQNIYSDHQRYVETLFNSILVSGQWSEGTSAFMRKLLLSPTIDQNDILTIISSIMLSLMNVFDVEKWVTLLSIYENAVYERVRQRAFVGWVLCAPKSGIPLFPEVEEGINRVLDDKMKREELLQLQMQLFYCANAESDKERIQKEIIPTLVKNSNLRASGSGFIERDDDMMRDILGTEDSDVEIEKLEKTMSQMMDMQKTGIDIYYGGFSQMKRFRFFYQLSNWFCPFNSEHPELRALADKLSGSNLLDTLLQNGPFCDSDKYSFAFAMASVFDRLPANVRNMVGNGEALGATVPTGQRESAAYVRRTYLQDLYRFFNIYQNRSDFDNPFSFTDDALASFFFADELFQDARLSEERLGLMKFLYRQKLYSHIKRLWQTGSESHSASEEKRIAALAYLQMGDYGKAMELLESVLADSPTDTVTLKGLAKASFALHDYAKSEEYYRLLVDASPDSLRDNLGLAVSQLNNGKQKMGMQVLFRLNYEHSDNIDVMRSLAWGYLMSGRADDAVILYDRLLNTAEPSGSDVLCAGYANWFLMRVDAALKHFRKYLDTMRQKTPTYSIATDFEEDKALFDNNDITESERNVMEYLVENDIS